MTTKKYRVDFVAHHSIVVEVHDDEYEDTAIDVAEELMKRNNVIACWEFEPDSVEEVSSEEEAENDLFLDDTF